MTVADFQGLADAGFAVVVNHRPDREEPGQPSAQELCEAAAENGLRMVLAPVRGLPDAVAVQRTAEALAGLGEGEKALMFCRSGARSTAAWAMAECAAGAEPATVRAIARRAGYNLDSLPL